MTSAGGIFPDGPLEKRGGLVTRADDILRKSDMGSWTKAAPELYPHQWSWDPAFMAIGLAHLDVRRAALELSTLFAHQWKTGKVPHIVFNPEAPPESYYPGAEHWACAASSPDAPPAPPYTSCLTQPPVHAITVWRIWEAAGRAGEASLSSTREFLHDIYPRLFAWHRYLATFRDPEGSGLVTIYHPWGSGTDNSPRWDGALGAVEVGALPPYPRYDLQHVDGFDQRPTDADYDRYLRLLKLIKDAGCDERTIYRYHPFLVKDVLSSAILVAANKALLEIAEVVKAPDGDRELITGWIQRGRRGLDQRWDADLGLCLPPDELRGRQAPFLDRSVEIIYGSHLEDTPIADPSFPSIPCGYPTLFTGVLGRLFLRNPNARYDLGSFRAPNLYTPPQHVVPSRHAGGDAEAILTVLGRRSMQDRANGLRRIPLPRTPVNKSEGLSRHHKPYGSCMRI